MSVQETKLARPLRDCELARRASYDFDTYKHWVQYLVVFHRNYTPTFPLWIPPFPFDASSVLGRVNPTQPIPVVTTPSPSPSRPAAQPEGKRLTTRTRPNRFTVDSVPLLMVVIVHTAARNNHLFIVELITIMQSCIKFPTQETLRATMKQRRAYFAMLQAYEDNQEYPERLDQAIRHAKETALRDLVNDDPSSAVPAAEAFVAALHALGREEDRKMEANE